MTKHVYIWYDNPNCRLTGFQLLDINCHRCGCSRIYAIGKFYGSYHITTNYERLRVFTDGFQNETFENTGIRLRGTMNRMLRMAERTGVGWKIWLLFFLAVSVLFWYVWLF
jgi:hypothetical protein